MEKMVLTENQQQLQLQQHQQQQQQQTISLTPNSYSRLSWAEKSKLSKEDLIKLLDTSIPTHSEDEPLTVSSVKGIVHEMVSPLVNLLVNVNLQDELCAAAADIVAKKNTERFPSYAPQKPHSDAPTNEQQQQLQQQQLQQQQSKQYITTYKLSRNNFPQPEFSNSPSEKSSIIGEGRAEPNGGSVGSTENLFARSDSPNPTLPRNRHTSTVSTQVDSNITPTVLSLRGIEGKVVQVISEIRLLLKRLMVLEDKNNQLETMVKSQQEVMDKLSRDQQLKRLTIVGVPEVAPLVVGKRKGTTDWSKINLIFEYLNLQFFPERCCRLDDVDNDSVSAPRRMIIEFSKFSERNKAKERFELLRDSDNELLRCISAGPTVQKSELLFCH